MAKTCTLFDSVCSERDEDEETEKLLKKVLISNKYTREQEGEIIRCALIAVVWN